MHRADFPKVGAAGDGGTWPQTTAPTTGEASVVQQATDYGSCGFDYQTKSATVYDSYGRAIDSYDANGNESVITYTMTNGLTTSEKATNPLGQSTTTTYDPLRGPPLTVTDPNGVVTTTQYDGLGRVIAEWGDSRYTATDTPPANALFGYTVVNNGPVVVTAKKLNDESGYITSTTIYDALLRIRQTQEPTPGAESL